MMDFLPGLATYPRMNLTDDMNTAHPLDKSERRRQIFERTLAKYAAAGIRIEDDADYMALITLWISGELEMRDAAAQYDDIRRRRGVARAAKAETPPPEEAAPGPAPDDPSVSGMTQAELIEELSKLSERL